MSTGDELQAQGIKLYAQHDYEAAGRAFQEAQTAYEQNNQPDMVAEMQVNMGLVHRALGEHQQALEMMQEALHTFQNLGDKKRSAQVLGNLGGVYLALSDKEQAFSAYRQAADIFLELEETQLYSETMMALGSLQVRDGKLFAGAAMYQVGLEALEDPNPRQKLMKRLASVITSLSGGN
jgi:tetratricopeptide (TPR) repeat protein